MGLCISRRNATAGAAGTRQRSSFSDAAVTGTVPAATAKDDVLVQRSPPQPGNQPPAPSRPSNVPELAAPPVSASKSARSSRSRAGKTALGGSGGGANPGDGSPHGAAVRSLRSELPDATLWDAYASALQRIPSPPRTSWEPPAAVHSTDPQPAAALTPANPPQQTSPRAGARLAGGSPPINDQQQPQAPRPAAPAPAAPAPAAPTQGDPPPLRSLIPSLLSMSGTDAAGAPERCLLRQPVVPADLPDGSAVYLARMREEELQQQQQLLLEANLNGADGADGLVLGPSESLSVPARVSSAVSLLAGSGGVGWADKKHPQEARRSLLDAEVAASLSSIEPPPGLRAGIADQADGAALGLEDAHMNIDPAELVIAHELGRGGFGCVYSGRYRGRSVAIKMLLGANTAGAELSALRLEVSILSRAKHPNIVRIYGCNLAGAQPFIVEELLLCTLHDYIYHPMADTRPLLLVMLARDMAAALEYLHPTVLHRDLKPSNVLLTKAGTPKLADFGLARWKLRTLLSTRSVEAGSVPYLAPECFDPDNWRLSDRIDIYSLGIIMNEMMTRRPPWEGFSTMDVATEVLVMGRRPAMPAPEDARWPPALLRLVRSCLAQKPTDRPSAAAVHRELTQLHEELKAAEAG